jgi:hypothetical protein
VPGEPVPEFGGMTPEQFTAFSAGLENLLVSTFGCIDGALSMYVHLTARMVLNIEEGAGTDKMVQVVDTFVSALYDEIEGQRKQRHLERERQQQAREHDKGLN